MLPVRRIVYATDFSSYSNQAYLHAIALAENHQAGLDILHVFVPGSGTLKGPAPDEVARRYWKEQLEQIRPLNGNIPIKHELLEGEPAAEIVRYVRTAGADLVVMGTHGRTGTERLVVGSVAERVLREAPCSVLVVKIPKGTSTAASSS